MRTSSSRRVAALAMIQIQQLVGTMAGLVLHVCCEDGSGEALLVRYSGTDCCHIYILLVQHPYG